MESDPKPEQDPEEQQDPTRGQAEADSGSWPGNNADAPIEDDAGVEEQSLAEALPGAVTDLDQNPQPVTDDAQEQVENYMPPEAAHPKTPAAAAASKPDETVKETIESIVIAFILAFVFRAFIVEPFIIPTGSMAPTMFGAHLTYPCESCGYRFDIGIDVKSHPEGSALSAKHSEQKTANCPMCNFAVEAEVGTRVRSGDRILVDKFRYHLVDPSRWDIVVFKAPQDETVDGQPGPRTNFIKRLIGLPGERIALLDGNVFVAPAGSDDFRIARKTDPDTNRHWQKIQRASWQPIYHSQFVPIGLESTGELSRGESNRWRNPWVPESGEWEMGSSNAPSRVYRFAGGDGRLNFEMKGPKGTLDFTRKNVRFPYNYSYGRTGGDVRSGQPIEDVRLACGMTPMSDSATLRLTTTARLDRPGEGREALTASLSMDGSVTLSATGDDGEIRSLGKGAKIAPLKRGVAVDVEFWLVDDEASVWVNGKRVVVQRFDLTWQQIAERLRLQSTPDISIEVTSDGPVELRRVELDRDLFFYAEGNTIDGIARAEARRVEGGITVGPNPVDLRTETADHDAELFVLGDNQPESKDSRKWDSLDGWVQQRHFGDAYRTGVVPRGLLVGRAFMVYYPAPHGSSPQAKGVFPDFGRMRFVH